MTFYKRVVYTSIQKKHEFVLLVLGSMMVNRVRKSPVYFA